MGLFGKKKTPEALLAEGRAQYESGDMKHMFLTLHGLANKGDPEACYYIGIYWLKEKSDKRMAEKYLTIAARGGQTDAAKLLAEQLGVGDFLPPAPEPAPVPQPAPSPAPASAPQSGGALTPEEQHAKGMELFRAGDYKGAYDLLRQVCRAIGSERDNYPDGQAAMGWMYEHGCGVDEANASLARRRYQIAARNGNRDGMAGMVRLAANEEQPGVSQCETALDYAKQLGTDEAKRLLPVLEQKLAEAQKREAAEMAQMQQTEELEQLFSEGVAAYNGKDYARALSLLEKAAQQGVAEAQFNCGMMYRDGEGTAADKAKALYWYEKAAQQGITAAQFTCGVMYDNGEGTAADKARAKLYFQKAADQTANKEVQEKAKKILRDRF